ncbi:phage antirepressor KilAC domain-containing protein [Stenotrophomonas geniculata]|jgi:hypothetical protein|uniref:phage antirepressor KilAC domain-containing protein n=1 Tax=Stenotrophomonas geniculata TaxID=86188 RepID=UPI003D349A12
MTHLLSIEGVQIREDHQGKFCLNDVHRAAGRGESESPLTWLALPQTQDLIGLFHAQGGATDHNNAPIPPVEIRQGLGAFVVKEFLLAYALWIAPDFNARVVHAVKSLTSHIVHNPPAALPPPALAYGQAISEPSLRSLARLTVSRRESAPDDRQFVESISISQFARVMEVDSIAFFATLRRDRVLMSGGTNRNMPQQRHVDSGYFTIREADPARNRPYRQARITAKGETWLKNKYFQRSEPSKDVRQESRREPIAVISKNEQVLPGNDEEEARRMLQLPLSLAAKGRDSRCPQPGPQPGNADPMQSQSCEDPEPNSSRERVPGRRMLGS